MYFCIPLRNPRQCKNKPFIAFSSWLCDLLGNLNEDVFERCTSTGSEAFSLFIYLDANKFVLLSFFPLLKTVYPRV